MAPELTHWEYSFLLHTSHLGEESHTGTDPFTGETVSFPIDDGLSDDEIDDILDLFDEHAFEGPDPDGEGYVMEGEGGDSLRFRCFDLEEGEQVVSIPVEIIVRELNDALLVVVLEIARAGQLILMSSTGGNVRMLDREANDQERTRWPDAKQLSTVAELRQWLEQTIEGRRVWLGS